MVLMAFRLATQYTKNKRTMYMLCDDFSLFNHRYYLWFNVLGPSLRLLAVIQYCRHVERDRQRRTANGQTFNSQ